MARICVVEDDGAVREQLTELLRHAGHEVVCVERFESVVADVLALSPDLVVLDLGLPGTDGQYVAREIRQRSTLPLMVLTSRSSELDELMSLSLGADDFLAKPYNGQILLAHIDAILRRSASASSEGRRVQWRGVTLDLARSVASAGDASCELTKNELRILELLMCREGGIVSREELMEALWNSYAFVDDNTLTVNMNRLRQTLAKIGVRDFVLTHRGQGYSV